MTDEKKLDKLTSKPTYVSSKIFNENLMAVHKIKEALTLNRPAFVGMCILDLSKTLMYDFHYNYFKEKYGDRAKLLFTDTDSLTHSHMRSKQEMYTRTFGMTKTRSIIATIQKTHYIITMLIRRSSENSKMKLVVSPLPNL